MTGNQITLITIIQIAGYILTHIKLLGRRPFSDKEDAEMNKSTLLLAFWPLPFLFYIIRAVILGVAFTIKNVFIQDEWDDIRAK